MKYTKILGIDVSKLTFDVADLKADHFQLTNALDGFTALLEKTDRNTLCVMEVTGIYHLQLAHFLYKNNVAVAVINPLSIKRFIQMHLKRTKTDKADAKMIARYADQQEVSLWKPADKLLEKSRDYYQVMEHYISIRASLKNILDTLKSKKAAAELIQNIKNQIAFQNKEIKEIEAEITVFIKQYDATLLTNLKSISGIGIRTALSLIIASNGFKNFTSAKQLASFFGLAPTQTTSGTSVKGKSKISKMGNPTVRKKLYMCSLQAKKYNKSCSQLYERLVAKGKKKKLALIAVANKLIKIVFAIAKSGIPYDNMYKSIQPKY